MYRRYPVLLTSYLFAVQAMTLKKLCIILVVVSMLHSSVASKVGVSRKSRKSRSLIFPKQQSETESQGPQPCVTFRGRSGRCVIVTNCQLLWNNRRNYNLLRKLNCGFEGEVPKVCCPGYSTSSIQPTAIATTMASTSSSSTAPTRPTRVRRPLVGLPLPPPPDTQRRTGEVTPSPERSSSQLPTLTSSNSPITTIQNSGNPAVARNYDEIMSLLPAECGENDVPLRRIVGGHESVIGAWPWLAAIYLTRRGIKTAECGGVLVTTKHVITAAHCTVHSRRGTTLEASQMTVRLGDHDLDSDDDGMTPVEVQVLDIIKHEHFALRTFQNDIAILLLVSSVTFHKYVSPLCLPYGVFEGDDLAGRNAFVAGWGTTSFDGPASSKLLEVQLRIWENRDCEEVFRREAPITSVNLCAGDGDKDACRGDSGGPLMLPHRDGRFYMVGIVSFGKKCAEPGIPGVYTRITAFLDWIADRINSTG